MDNNTFALILAGGSGKRMGNPDKPKQFLMLGGKPILVHTIEKFCVAVEFRSVIVLCPDMWVRQTKDLVSRYLPHLDHIEVVAGGPVRNDTIMKGLDYIEKRYGMDDDTIVVTHDAGHRIIQENVAAMEKFDACDTVVAATDTIVESTNGEMISCIPNRRNYYQGQTPQSFKATKLRTLYGRLSDEDKLILTDACKIFTMCEEPVALIRGDVSNIKITYPHDMRVARAMMEQQGETDA